MKDKFLKKHRTKYLARILVAIGLFFLGVILKDKHEARPIRGLLPVRVRSTSSIKAPVKMKKARWEYFFRLLRDPASNEIPPGIRERELNFARTLRRTTRTPTDTLFQWKEAGPHNLGGRTRALAVDVADPNVIIAGGVSGGIWKSTDGGATWISKSDPSQNLSITTLVQDPRTNHTTTWYYATGEFVGNTASDWGYRSFFFGTGLYKSTDNGETWNRLPDAWGSNPTLWDSPFDFVTRIVVSPITGTVFVSSNGVGIFRSDDQGRSFDLVLGGVNDHYFADVVVASHGKVIAALSEFGSNPDPQYPPGLYVSTNDGLEWKNITPDSFPEFHKRTILAVAPSNPDIVYVLTFTGMYDDDEHDDVRFHKIDLQTGESEDRSQNLPDFGPDGYVNTQSNYNMVVAVKPDDEDFVLIGATSLFRSENGFSIRSPDMYGTWIGGYEPGKSPAHYPNLHPDQHVIAFDPHDPDRLWIGHDGGLSYASDITVYSSATYYFPWKSKNNGYNVTQFYTIAIPYEEQDERIMGGTQDNGTPFFTWNNVESSTSRDVSSGDGGFAYFGNKFAYTSSHNGRILRLAYNLSGRPSYYAGWTIVTPEGAKNKLFITPFTIDPNDENIMYYAAGNSLWRNDRLSSIPENKDSTSVGWSELSGLAVQSGYTISTMAVSRHNPGHVLYYGASSSSGPPKLYRLENAHTAEDGEEDISIPGAADGAYVHDIAVNPNDANEILVVLSNYNVVGLFHSINPGEEFLEVEGNLEGSAQNPGPSLRSATILPFSGGSIYLLGTSTGVYSTILLDGTNTVWNQEGANEIGNVVVADVTSRPSDGRVAVGTHGRGVFIGQFTSDYEKLPTAVALKQNYPNPFNRSTTIEYELSKPSEITLSVFNIKGQLVQTLASEYKTAGKHSIQWDARHVGSGLYLYRIQTGNSTEIRKCILVK